MVTTIVILASILALAYCGVGIDDTLEKANQFHKTGKWQSRPSHDSTSAQDTWNGFGPF